MTADQFLTIRREAGLTQGGLAQLLRVTELTINRYERGKTGIPGPVELLMEMLVDGRLK